MKSQELIDTANASVAGDKGILAMDESNATCNKRLAALGIWKGEDADVSAAQRPLIRRAVCDRAARRGEYSAAMESS